MCVCVYRSNIFLFIFFFNLNKIKSSHEKMLKLLGVCLVFWNVLISSSVIRYYIVVGTATKVIIGLPIIKSWFMS